MSSVPRAKEYSVKVSRISSYTLDSLSLEHNIDHVASKPRQHAIPTFTKKNSPFSLAAS